MEKIVNRFPVHEILGYLCPGIVLLTSLRLWSGFDLNLLLGRSLTSSTIILSAILLVLAYGAGVLVGEWSDAGTHAFMQLRLANLSRAAFLPPRSRRLMRSSILWAFHWIPLPRIERSFVEAQVMMSARIEAESHMFGLSRIWSPWDRLELFRVLVSRNCDPSAREILEKSSLVHARLLYCMGMSLTLTLVAVEGLLIGVARLCVAPADWFAPLVPLSAFALCVIASLGLRRAAGRSWELELALVCSLGEWRET